MSGNTMKTKYFSSANQLQCNIVFIDTFFPLTYQNFSGSKNKLIKLIKSLYANLRFFKVLKKIMKDGFLNFLKMLKN